MTPHDGMASPGHAANVETAARDSAVVEMVLLLPRNDYERLEAAAAAGQVTLGRYVRRALRRHLERKGSGGAS